MIKKTKTKQKGKKIYKCSSDIRSVNHCLEHVPDLHGKGGLVDRDIYRGRWRTHFLSSHNCAHVSTGSFFSRYIWKMVVMLHGYLVSLLVSFSGCTIMVSFPHPMPFEGVYILFVHYGSVVSYLPLMAQRYAHGQHQCLLTWWSECEQERKERKRIIPAAQPTSFPSLASVSRRWRLVVTQNPLFLFS